MLKQVGISDTEIFRTRFTKIGSGQRPYETSTTRRARYQCSHDMLPSSPIWCQPDISLRSTNCYPKIIIQEDPLSQSGIYELNWHEDCGNVGMCTHVKEHKLKQYAEIESRGFHMWGLGNLLAVKLSVWTFDFENVSLRICCNSSGRIDDDDWKIGALNFIVSTNVPLPMSVKYLPTDSRPVVNLMQRGFRSAEENDNVNFEWCDLLRLIYSDWCLWNNSTLRCGNHDRNVLNIQWEWMDNDRTSRHHEVPTGNTDPTWIISWKLYRVRFVG